MKVTGKTKEISETRNKILEIQKTEEKLKKEKKELLNKLRAICDHQAIIECDYKPSDSLFHALPPQRLCIICNITEEGWGSGYKKLSNSDNVIKTISRNDFFDRLKKLGPLRSIKTLIPE